MHIALRKTTLQVAGTSKGARASSGDLLVARLCATFKRSVCGSVQSLKRSLGGMSLFNSQQISWWNVAVQLSGDLLVASPCATLKRSLGGISVQSFRRSLGDLSLCDLLSYVLVACLCAIFHTISWWHVSVQSPGDSLVTRLCAISQATFIKEPFACWGKRVTAKDTHTLQGRCASWAFYF